MIYDSLMIHYGELSTKGDNRRLFVNQLTHNVRLALRRFPGTEAWGGRDHLYVSLKGQNPEPIIADQSGANGRCVKRSSFGLIKGRKGKYV